MKISLSVFLLFSLAGLSAAASDHPPQRDFHSVALPRDDFVPHHYLPTIGRYTADAYSYTANSWADFVLTKCKENFECKATASYSTLGQHDRRDWTANLYEVTLDTRDFGEGPRGTEGARAFSVY